MAAFSAKHRALVPTYESVSAAQSGSKISTIQRVETVKSAGNERAPAINSKANFPTLGNASASASSVPQWGASSTQAKKQTQVSKKLKVAPAPLLQQSTPASSKQKADEKPKAKSGTKKEEATIEQKNSPKKDKKSNEKVDKNNGKSNETKENKKKNGENKKHTNGPLVLQNGHANSEATASANGNSVASAPPGFSNSNSDSVKPPPGFQGTSSNVHEYAAPSNATQRNQILVSYFQKALKTPEGVEQFRTISKLFREDLCAAQSFYEHCEATLGQQFHSIFPELLILLPDIRKQQVN